VKQKSTFILRPVSVWVTNYYA